MISFRSLVAAGGIAVGMMAWAAPGGAQTHDHGPASAGQAHSHAGPAVDCSTLATPPWVGLPASDRQSIQQIQAAVANLTTVDAARAAGFRPALGNIPTMGVHWVHGERSRSGVKLSEPDHLLFAPIGGVETLVGVAYAFADAVDTNVPVPFESDLAHWHDHPEFAGRGQTLHMLHVWFIPSSNGPFAGNNFWLPFLGAKITPPSACWMADEETSDRIQTIAMLLSLYQMDEQSILARAGLRALGGREQTPQQRLEAVSTRLVELDRAAAANDRAGWMAAADALLTSRPAGERMAAQLMLRTLTMAQMSSQDREHAGH
jgi:hypothetical protein